MKNLFALIWRNNFFLLFLILQSICFFLMVSNKKYHQASFLNSTNKAVANVNKLVSAVTQYINLKENNEALSRENAALKSLFPDVFYIDSAQKIVKHDTLYKQQYTFTPARIINNSVNRRNNYLTLDKGTAQGVGPGMAVITSQGIVGVVKDVSEHYSSVMSVLHKEFKLSVRVKKNGYIGSLVWEGYNSAYVTLDYIARHVPVAKGDTIVTSNFSSIFPEGVMVGTIDNVDDVAGDFFKIRVKLSADLGSLTYVYVVNNLMRNEQVKLEEGQVQDDH